MVANLPVGKASTFNLVRDGKLESLKVVLQEQPEDFDVASTPNEEFTPRRSRGNNVAVEKAGVEVTDLTSDMAERFGYTRKDKGALITHVDADSPASDAGLQPRMLITKVDKAPVKSADDFRDQVEKGSLAKGLLLQVQLPSGGTNFVMLKSTETSQK
jgi:serine protease Do